ncbi:hypothetical protein BKA65DRAFT_43548 [Rhexocercosporidium sp. MPI-PUGE-AT-0058]|nr:hypothetical protein BKA65DRAFT_43548 [Rhexocercosporidium sp. MPI-PUGE-AT-0058]
MEALYSALGYGKAEAPEKFKGLDKDIHAYFTAYQNQVSILGSRDALSDQILLCATNYMTEESRGEKLWPENRRGIPVWPIDEQFIIHKICHIFRRKGKAANVGRCNARKRARQAEGTTRNKPRAKSRKRGRRDDNEEDDVGAAKRFWELSETTVKPWNEPPKGPDPRFCSQYIQSLNLKNDVKRVTAFTTEWLKEDGQWPEVADVKLQTFMHNHGFYVHYDYGDDHPLDLINILRKGPEIETLENGLLYVEFQNRIRDRVEFLTHHPLFRAGIQT